MSNLYTSIIDTLKGIFNLSIHKADYADTISSIEKGVEFKGINVYTLIFAIFVASIGLNVNSTAVIIGAMLISPLMGPIMGLGLSVGIYDFSLLKKSFKNLVIMVSISLITSTLYFAISPLDEAQSELLARTTPTIYDVLIALFGGLAGIVAGSSKEKGTVIPGVAIATALMPPLCTAGFGIATGNLYYFAGAAYLFFINAVMISLSAFLIVRFLKFPYKQMIDKARQKKVKNYITAIVLLTVLPSIYFAYQIIQQTIFKSNVLGFINKEFDFQNTQVIDKTYQYNHLDSNELNIVLAGEKISDEEILKLNTKKYEYGLGKTKVKIKQGAFQQKMDISQIRTGIIEEIYRKNELKLAEKDSIIQKLTHQNNELNVGEPIEKVAREIKVINPNILSMSYGKTKIYNLANNSIDTTLIVYISTTSALSKTESSQIREYLKQRLSTNNIKLIIER